MDDCVAGQALHARSPSDSLRFSISATPQVLSFASSAVSVNGLLVAHRFGCKHLVTKVVVELLLEQPCVAHRTHAERDGHLGCGRSNNVHPTVTTTCSRSAGCGHGACRWPAALPRRCGAAMKSASQVQSRHHGLRLDGPTPAAAASAARPSRGSESTGQPSQPPRHSGSSD